MNIVNAAEKEVAMERSKWSHLLLFLIAACSAPPRRASVAPVIQPAVRPAPPVKPAAVPSQAGPGTHELREALAMIEGVCERDLVAQPRTNDAEHDALFGVCQALAVVHDDQGRRKKETKNRTEAAEHWTRATKIDLWPDPPVRFARLQLARLDEPPRRETFCNAIGALSQPLRCSADLPLAELATANACGPIVRCEPANGPSSPPTSGVRPPLEGDAIDKAALEIVRSAACNHVVKDGDTLLRALSRTIGGWQAC